MLCILETGWPLIHRDLPASSSQGLESEVYATVNGKCYLFKHALDVLICYMSVGMHVPLCRMGRSGDNPWQAGFF